MIGRGYLNAGGYGCVFSPPIKSEDTSSIGKVFDDYDDFKSEMNKIKTVQDIDPDNVFTVKYQYSNVVHAQDFRQSDEPQYCKKVKFYTKKKYYQIVYKNGGVSLVNTWRNSVKERLYIEDVLEPLRSIFVGLVELGRRKQVHQDIKPDNLLYDADNQRFNIIDFGIMEHFDKVYTDSNSGILDFDYLYYPPEMKLWVMRRQQISLSFDKFMEYFGRNFYSGSVDLHEFVQRYQYNVKNLKDFYYDTQLSHANMKGFVHKIDVYGLGIVLYIALQNFAAKRMFRNREIMNRLYTLVGMMTCFDPRRRVSPEAALDAFDKIRMY